MQCVCCHEKPKCMEFNWYCFYETCASCTPLPLTPHRSSWAFSFWSRVYFQPQRSKKLRYAWIGPLLSPARPDWSSLILWSSTQLSQWSVLLISSIEPAVFLIVPSASTQPCSILKTVLRGNLKCRAAWIFAPWENVQAAKPSNKLLGTLRGHTSPPTQPCALPGSQRLLAKTFSMVLEGNTEGKVLLATQLYERQEGNKTKKKSLLLLTLYTKIKILKLSFAYYLPERAVLPV